MIKEMKKLPSKTKGHPLLLGEYLDNLSHILLTKNWAKSLLRCLGYVKRRASSKANISISEFEAHKDQFAFDVKSMK